MQQGRGGSSGVQLVSSEQQLFDEKKLQKAGKKATCIEVYEEDDLELPR